MKIESIEQMEEKHYHKGFDKHLNEQYRQQLESGAPEFTIGHKVTIKETDEMSYELRYRRDDEKGEIYLNTIKATLSSKDFEGLREHVFTDDSMITAGEMHRMLKHGELVAVNKNLYNKEGNAYNAWLTVDVTGAKDQYGNYPVQYYHENFFKKEPFDIQEKLKALVVPVKEIEISGELEKMERAFKKANLYEVTILHNGQEAKGYLSVNPEKRRIEVLDAGLNIIERQENKKALPAERQEAPAQGQEEVKKKSQPEQKVNWTRSNQQQKGISR